MSYVFDEDLEFLGECSDQQLAKLLKMMMGKLEELKRLQEVMTIKDMVEIIVNTGKF